MKQEDAILDWLRAGNSLSPLEALQRFQCLRLGARVFDLRRKGHAIVSRTERQGRKAWSVYMLNAAQQVPVSASAGTVVGEGPGSSLSATTSALADERLRQPYHDESSTPAAAAPLAKQKEAA